MSSTKADAWIIANGENFKPEHMITIKEKLNQMPDAKIDMLLTVQFKKPMTMLLISILVGEFGVDRFMLGETGLGIAKLLTLGGCGIWWVIDMFTVSNRTKDKNFQMFMQAAG